MRQLGQVVLLIFTAALHKTSHEQKEVFSKAIRCIQALVHFHLMAKYRSHTDETIALP